MQIKSVVPLIYQSFLSPKVLQLSAVETKATCSNCLRSRDRRFAYAYKENLKCCTFHPYLPNYAVGALLSETIKTSGILKIEEKIKLLQFALPIGLMAPFDYQLSFLSKNEDEFGNRADLLCPYFSVSQNQCSIWQYRGVVCTSFYCRSDHGQAGQRFWAVFSDYLSYVEMALAEECLVQTDFSPRDISDQLMYLNKREFSFTEQTQKSIEPNVDKVLWNGYDDKFQYYQKCFAIIQKIDRNQFKEILGQQGLELEKEVIEYGHRR